MRARCRGGSGGHDRRDRRDGTADGAPLRAPVGRCRSPPTCWRSRPWPRSCGWACSQRRPVSSPCLPVEPITWLAGMFAAYITQIAAWTSAPGWAQLEVGLSGPWALARNLRGARPRRMDARAPARTGARAPRVATLGPRGVGAGVDPAHRLAASGRAPQAEPARGGLVVRFLDVGQGDAILLDAAPRRSDPRRCGHARRRRGRAPA